MNQIKKNSKYVLAMFMIVAGTMHFANPAFFLTDEIVQHDRDWDRCCRNTCQQEEHRKPLLEARNHEKWYKTRLMIANPDGIVSSQYNDLSKELLEAL